MGWYDLLPPGGSLLGPNGGVLTLKLKRGVLIMLHRETRRSIALFLRLFVT